MSPSSSASSAAAGSALGGSHAGLALALAATAMALSGTLVLFSLCRANKLHQHLVVSSSDGDPATTSPARQLRPCLSSSEKRKKRDKARRGSKKRVRFADDVVDNGAVAAVRRAPETEEEESRPRAPEPSCGRTTPMPANREALYRGMLRGRSMLRVACSY